MTKSVQFSQAIRSWMDVFMHRSMRGWGLFAKSTGLSMPQFSILMQLHHKGVCGLSDISERFDISSAAASQLVDRLVQSGLVERIEDPNDRRAKQLTITPKGRELIETGIVERTRWAEELVESLTPGEYEVVSSTLGTLAEAVRRLEQPKVSK